MGTTSSDIWFDSDGQAVFWQNVPMKTVKKALFTKGNTVRQLAKLMFNSVTYDFRKTAEGGAVIVPPDYSAIELISPDGRIDYADLLNGSLGNAISETIAVLRNDPISSWDKFAKWAGTNSMLNMAAGYVSTCNLTPIGGGSSVAVNVPEFSDVANMVELLEAVYTATTAAHGKALSLYRLDDKSYGFQLGVSGAGQSLSIGFIFRE